MFIVITKKRNHLHCSPVSTRESQTLYKEYNASVRTSKYEIWNLASSKVKVRNFLGCKIQNWTNLNDMGPLDPFQPHMGVPDIIYQSLLISHFASSAMNVLAYSTRCNKWSSTLVYSTGPLVPLSTSVRRVVGLLPNLRIYQVDLSLSFSSKRKTSLSVA
jgi:hypothetical protein